MVDLSIVTVVYQRVHVTCSTCFQPSALSQTPGKITPLHGFAGAKHPLSCHRSSAHSVSHCGVWPKNAKERNDIRPAIPFRSIIVHDFAHTWIWKTKGPIYRMQTVVHIHTVYHFSTHTHTHTYIYTYISIYIYISYVINIYIYVYIQYIYIYIFFFFCVCVFVCARRKPIQLSACNVDLWRRTWPRCTSSGSGGIEIWKSVTSRVYCSCWKRKCPGNAVYFTFISLLYHFYQHQIHHHSRAASGFLG